jgi:cell division septation protein DedD
MPATATRSSRPTTAPSAPEWEPEFGWDDFAEALRPGLFSRRGVHLVAVGLVSLTVGIVIGSTMRGPSAAAKPNAIAPAAALSQQQVGTLPTSKSHALTPAKPAAAPKAPVAAPVTPPKAQVASNPTDKGWVVQSLTVKKEDITEDYIGSARITNTNRSSKSAGFTITLFRNGRQLAVLQGTVLDVAAGKTVTVDLLSNDRYSVGSYKYDFQVDVSV